VPAHCTVPRGNGGAAAIPPQFPDGDAHVPAATGPEEGGDPLPAGSGILLVDDDTELLLCLQTYLKHHGYAVHSEYHSLRALTWYREHWREIALVVTDVDMPWLTGYALLRGLAAINPQVAAIVMSGFDHLLANTDCPATIIGHLRKPFDLHMLVDLAATHVPPSGPQPAAVRR